MEKIKLSELSTLPPSDFRKEEGENRTDGYITKLNDLQNVLFAQSKYSILIVLQGMDASGKDGVIKKVFSGINPMGCRVAAFKKPTDEEMKHEFLWRIHKQVPEKGMIQIFNRSHYEDVIIQRVHKWVDEKTIIRRYEHINHFESLLQENDTIVLKFYLHVSQKEQMERLTERLSDPKKMWKYNPGDMDESKRWPEYMDAYERAFTNCSPDIPWTIVPADKNWYKEYLIAKVLVEALERLELKYPVLEKNASK